MLTTVHPTLMTMCMTWGQHVLFMLYNITLFQNLLLHFPQSHDQFYTINFVTDVTVWLINPNPSCSNKNENEKVK